MIFDCFTFFNELDLLEIRLHTLKDVVDKFVIATSSRPRGRAPDMAAGFARTWNSYLYFPVSALVDESAKFHHIANDTVEDDVVANIYAIILMFSINARRDRFKRRWRGKPFTNGNLNIGL